MKLIALKNELENFKNQNKDFIKMNEIINNIQMCYGWTTLSILNKYVSTNDLNNKIESQQKQIKILTFLIIILIILYVINIFKK